MSLYLLLMPRPPEQLPEFSTVRTVGKLPGLPSPSWTFNRSLSQTRTGQKSRKFLFHCSRRKIGRNILTKGLKNCLPNRTGGEVQSMRWDPTGERLAVSFVGSNLIAIFQVSLVFRV